MTEPYTGPERRLAPRKYQSVAPGIVRGTSGDIVPDRVVRERMAYEEYIATVPQFPVPKSALGPVRTLGAWRIFRRMFPEAPLPHAGQNDPCPCGASRKFKKCCGR